MIKLSIYLVSSIVFAFFLFSVTVLYLSKEMHRNGSDGVRNGEFKLKFFNSNQPIVDFLANDVVLNSLAKTEYSPSKDVYLFLAQEAVNKYKLINKRDGVPVIGLITTTTSGGNRIIIFDNRRIVGVANIKDNKIVSLPSP